jgi:ABC-2 type transport system ATP-binding protein
MIELHGLTKRYGPTLAVDDLSFQVQPGKVTGFLGPNGAGKSTSMRMVLGLDRPSAGQALVDGRPYQALRAPLRVVGALLDAGAVHPRRSAHDHLLALARSNGIPRSRVEEVLGLVGLDRVAGRRAGAYSLGMRRGWGSPPPCSATPASSCSTSPSTGWTPTASAGSASSSRTWPPRDGRCLSPAT